MFGLGAALHEMKSCFSCDLKLLFLSLPGEEGINLYYLFAKTVLSKLVGPVFAIGTILRA